MKKHPDPRMTQDQKRYLLSELGRLTSWGSGIRRERTEDKKPEKPAVVRAWEREMESFHAQQKKLGDAYKRQFGADEASVRKEIHFGSAEEALRKLEQFAAKYR